MMALARKAAPCRMPPLTLQWLSFNILHGRGTELVKMDLKDLSAPPRLPAVGHPKGRDGGDHSLPFGLRSAP